MFSWFRITGFLAVFFVAACGSVDYDSAPEGEFSGSLFVMWIDEGRVLG